MRKLLKWILVTVGITALVRWLRSRGAAPEVVPAAESQVDLAEELRRKLTESRSVDESEEATEKPEATVEERRADVHAEGRAALYEMKSTDDS